MIQAIEVGIYEVLGILRTKPALSAASEYLVRTTDPSTVPQRIAKALHYSLAYEWISVMDERLIDNFDNHRPIGSLYK